MIRIVFVLAVSGLVFAAAPARAQNPPAENPPTESAPAAEAPAPNAPEETKPVETKPPENKSVETKPAEINPPENKAAEGRPAESKSTETAPPEMGESRYTFSRVQDGYVRLDNRTGQVSFCSRRAVGWACQLVPEDRIAFETEITRLQDENAALKRDLLTRGLALPSNVKTEPPPAQGRERTSLLPNEATMDRVRFVIGQLWRRLVDMIVHVRQEVLKKS
jgi:hypothetical protein